MFILIPLLLFSLLLPGCSQRIAKQQEILNNHQIILNEHETKIKEFSKEIDRAEKGLIRFNIEVDTINKNIDSINKRIKHIDQFLEKMEDLLEKEFSAVNPKASMAFYENVVSLYEQFEKDSKDRITHNIYITLTQQVEDLDSYKKRIFNTPSQTIDVLNTVVVQELQNITQTFYESFNSELKLLKDRLLIKRIKNEDIFCSIGNYKSDLNNLAILLSSNQSTLRKVGEELFGFIPIVGTIFGVSQLIYDSRFNKMIDQANYVSKSIGKNISLISFIKFPNEFSAINIEEVCSSSFDKRKALKIILND